MLCGLFIQTTSSVLPIVFHMKSGQTIDYISYESKDSLANREGICSRGLGSTNIVSFSGRNGIVGRASVINIAFAQVECYEIVVG